MITAAVALLATAALAQPQKSMKTADGPLSYSQLITGNARTQHGYFTIHQVEDKYYFEIPDSLLGRDIMVVNRVVKAVIGSGMYAGDEIGQLGDEKLIRFGKGEGNKIDLYTISYSVFPKDSSSPMFMAVNNSNQQPVSGSFPIKAVSKDGRGSIIDVTELIRNGGILANGSAKDIFSVKAYSSNIEITAFRNVPYTPIAKGTEENTSPAEEPKGGDMEMNSSLLLLPKDRMQPRYFDQRVGYMSAGYTDFDENGIRKVSMIHRWRLEPKAEDMEKYKRGELVEPQKPIVFYLDPAIPKKWVPYFIQGVSDWEPVFEKAGFRNAIMARMAPTKEEDSSWSLEDASHSAIVYKPSSTENAMGYHIVDPRSGEIIESHINWYHNIIKLLHDWYMIQAGPSDPRARKMVFDDSLMGQLLRQVAVHEVGHAIGLQHDMQASSTVPVEKLRDKSWVDAHGISPSIMDYARFNYVAQPEDSISGKGLTNHIGDYDRWAVEWGYRLFPQFKGPGEEKGWLNQWVREKLKDHRLRWAEETGTATMGDPRVQTEDLGDDAVVASDYGITNLRRVMPNLLQWTKVPNEDYSNLADMYHEIISLTPNGGNGGMALGQFSRYMFHVIRYIGGLYKMPEVVEDNGPVYVPVSKSKQKEAVDFLNRQLFATPYWLVPPDIISKTGDNPLTLVGQIQRLALDLLFMQVVNDLFRNQVLAGDTTYKAIDLLTDLKKGIWGELATRKPIDAYRRQLQRKYVSMLISTLHPQGGGGTELSGMAIAQLTGLQKEIASALPSAPDMETSYHLRGILRMIDAGLKDLKN